jgi:hypothetical protein
MTRIMSASPGPPKQTKVKPGTVLKGGDGDMNQTYLVFHGHSMTMPLRGVRIISLELGYVRPASSVNSLFISMNCIYLMDLALMVPHASGE